MDKRDVLEWVRGVQEESGIYAVACGYDPWHMRDIPTRDAYESYFGHDNFRQIRQGAQTLSQPMKELKALYRENRIVDNNNPIAAWCRSNGNIMPDKKNQDPRNRIDAFAAELDAYITLKDMQDEYESMIGA
jgi:phage terminase large subunit-like protein